MASSHVPGNDRLDSRTTSYSDAIGRRSESASKASRVSFANDLDQDTKSVVNPLVHDEDVATETSEDHHEIEVSDSNEWDKSYWWKRVSSKDGSFLHPLDRWPTSPIGIVEKISYIWVSRLIRIANRYTIDEDAMPSIPDKDEASILTDAVEKEWRNRLAADGPEKASLVWSFYHVFRDRFWKTCFFMAVESAVQILQAYVVGQLVGSVTDEKSDGVVYSWAAAMTVTTFLYGPICHHQAFMNGWRFASVCMTVTLGLVYRKSLRVSQQGLAKVSAGHVTNLVTNDAERFMLGCIFIYFLVLAPLQLLAGLYLLWRQVGWPAIFGPLLLVLLAPLYRWLGRVLKQLRLRTAKITDERVKKMNEFIIGMRVIKMNAWESPLHKLIKTIRSDELHAIRLTNYIRAFSMSLYFVSPVLACFVVLMPYSLNGNILTNEKVFFCIALFQAIRFPVAMGLPNSIQALAELTVVFQRLKEFLLLDEVTITKSNKEKLSNPTHVKLSNVCCAWDAKSSDSDKSPSSNPRLTLNNVDIEIRRGELLMVIGPVGCGKSSLLMTLLGELDPVSGTVEINGGQMGYASQDSWIMSDTVQNNIIFGHEFDENRFDMVVECCQLQRDLDLLPEGEETILGERGVNLSGGQRARIGLARAVYHNPDLILLDDPLSAVDAKVGHHIFDECIINFLEGKTRILVTHQVQYASSVDRILVLSESGSVSAIGTYTELVKAGINLEGLVYTDPVSEASETLPEASVPYEEKLRRPTNVTGPGVEIPKSRRRSSVVAETSSTGKISANTYLEYARNAGGIFFSSFTIVLFIISQLLEMYASYYLKDWASQSAAEQQRDRWIHFYAIITGVTVTMAFARSFVFMYGCMKASNGLHAKVVSSVLRFPILFFDTNPAGRILNRFSKDTGYIDDLLPVTFLDFFASALLCASSAIVASIINPYIFVMSVPLTIVFFLLRSYYLKASREIKRLEAVLRSPKYSLLSSTLSGLATIRSQEGASEQFTDRMHNLQNKHLSAFMMFMVGSRWLGFRLDLIGFFFIISVTFVGIATRDDLGGGDLGLSLVYIMALSGLFQWMVRQSAEVENQMTAVERMAEYGNLDNEQSESAMECEEDSDPWPTNGTLEFEDFSLSYAPGGEAALESLSLSIKDKEKIGIVGRTGAGKSSLLAALFRLSYTQHGRVLVGGKDICDVPLKKLRSSLSVIPQEPVLFSGTIRLNVDPFGEYNDNEIWSVLGDVQLKEILKDGLETEVTENGQNYSVGQRQLICMARAMLQKNKILILDEATANIDSDTDQLIQKIIRSKFTDWTVLTIAHRLNTVIDSDRILVLDNGQLVDFDTPEQLLKKEDGLLAELAAYSKRGNNDDSEISSR